MLMIPAGNPGPWTGPTGNNTYLLIGARPALIDAGIGDEAHLSAIEAALEGQRLETLLITHGHRDHTAGIPAIRARWPEVVVRNHGEDRCRDGERLAAGDSVLRAIYTPGHSPDHFCLLDESTRDLYCGDLAREGGTIVIPASQGGNLGAYLASLRRVRDLARAAPAAAGARAGGRRPDRADRRLPRASCRPRASDSSTRCDRDATPDEIVAEGVRKDAGDDRARRCRRRARASDQARRRGACGDDRRIVADLA